MSQPNVPNETPTEPSIDKISAAFTLLNSPDLVDASLSVDVTQKGDVLNTSLVNYKNAIEIVIQGLNQLTLFLNEHESLEHAVKNIDSFLRMRKGVTHSLSRLNPDQRAEKIAVEKVKTYFSIAKEVIDIFLIPEDTEGPFTIDEYLKSLAKRVNGYLEIKVLGFDQSASNGYPIAHINTDTKVARLACLEILMNALKYGMENESGNLIVQIHREKQHSCVLYRISNHMGNGYSYEHSTSYGLSLLKNVFGEKTSSRQEQGIFIVEIYTGNLVES